MTPPPHIWLSKRVRPLATRGLAVLAVVLLACWAWAGRPLFTKPRSVALLDRDGRLLGARVAADGQWRLDEGSAPLDPRFETCLLRFEDRYFHRHPGINPVALVRAVWQNVRAGRVLSGGSTITMQVARLARGGERTLVNKVLDMALAVGLELRFSKAEILRMHAAHAPFGGNVVGLEAASWRFFGHSPHALSWAEAATLAVLPNAPSLMHPGRHREALRAKRDRLLDRLLADGRLTELEWSLAREEPLPSKPMALPDRAPHLLATLGSSHAGTIRCTVDGALQERAAGVLDRHAQRLRSDRVMNAAAVIMDITTGEVLAYVGNLRSAGGLHNGQVDLVRARRSTGSLLKPFLYAAQLDVGELLPDMLVADLPVHYDGFAPGNYDGRYQGAVPASTALARSLNVPAVRALRQHGIDRSLRLFRAMGIRSLERSADHYGLSLILGGGETTLLEITGAYAGLARVRAHHGRSATDPGQVVRDPIVIAGEPARTGPSPITASGAHFALEALTRAARPTEEAGWQHFAGARRIAWKTGTSYGHRDAWAIGVTEQHAIGVWCGNADGEGRPGLTGGLMAAPVLFELFGLMEPGPPPSPPHDLLVPWPLCRRSGHRAQAACPDVDTVPIPRTGLATPPCPYHRMVWCTADRAHRASGQDGGTPVPWFVLPPAMEAYYAPTDPLYLRLPPPLPGTAAPDLEDLMQLIYPEPGSVVLLARELDGRRGRVVAEAAHREAGAVIHWHVDGRYRATTRTVHRPALDLDPGPHRLTLSDTEGRSTTVHFRVAYPGPDP